MLERTQNFDNPYINLKNQRETLRANLTNLTDIQIRENNTITRQINTIKDLLTYKNNLSAPDYSKINRNFYFNKIIDYNKSYKSNKMNQTFYKFNSAPKFLNSKLKSRIRLSNTSSKINKNIYLIPKCQINRQHQNSLAKIQEGELSNISLYFKNMQKALRFSDYIQKKNRISKMPTISVSYKYNNQNLYNDNKLKIKIKANEKEDKSIDYDKYILRGLSLTTEQTEYFNKCQDVDCGYIGNSSSKKNNNMKGIFSENNKDENNNNIDNKFNKKGKSMKNKNFGDIKFLKYNNIKIKYSLNDLLKCKNPIKIKI